VGVVARWALPSFASLSLLVILYLLWMDAWRFLLDSDTGWHIRTGELIAATGRVPREDPFSHTLPGSPWFAWEWLTDLGMAKLHEAAGLGGVVLGSLVVLLLAYALLQALMRQWGADPLIATGLTFLAALCSIVHWLARPHLLSILLLVIWLWMVEGYRRRGKRWIYAIPVLILLWANLHGAFVITLPILLIYAVAEWGEQRLRGEHQWRRLLPYLVAAGGSALAALGTPFGFGLYRHLWQYLQDEELLRSIQEFQSPDFHTLDGKLIEILLLLGAGAVMLALRRGRLVELGLYLLWFHLTLQSQRHVTLAAVTLTPIIAEQATWAVREVVKQWVASAGKGQRLLRALVGWYRGILAIDRQLTGALVLVIVLAGLAGVAGTGAADKLLSARFSPERFPVEAASVLLRESLPDKGYAHDQFGGYLIYRLSPRYRVFVDGRSDFYRQGTVLADMQKVAGVSPEWATKLDQYGIQWLLLRRDEPLSLVARLSGDWVLLHEDKVAQILIRADLRPPASRQSDLSDPDLSDPKDGKSEREARNAPSIDEKEKDRRASASEIRQE
jgi:hypothetical protein